MDLSKLFRCSAQLVEQIGEERYAALIDPNNTGKVKKFGDELIQSVLPTEITVGGVTYEIIPILKGKEKLVSRDVMMGRAVKADALLGMEDGQRFIRNWQDIPPVFCNKVEFLFPDWRGPDQGDLTALARVGWQHEVESEGRWGLYWYSFCAGCGGDLRLLRRKVAA